MLGLAALLGGVITSLVILGVVGFLLMLGGTLMIGSAFRGPKQAAANAGTGTGSAGSTQKRAAKSPKNSDGFMSKVEERWRKRREGEGI